MESPLAQPLPAEAQEDSSSVEALLRSATASADGEELATVTAAAAEAVVAVPQDAGINGNSNSSFSFLDELQGQLAAVTCELPTASPFERPRDNDLIEQEMGSYASKAPPEDARYDNVQKYGAKLNTSNTDYKNIFPET